MLDQVDVLDAVRRRYSCRTYDGRPLSAALWADLQALVNATGAGPHGTEPRIELLPVVGDDRARVRLGTYGFISRPSAYMVGVVSAAGDAGVLEDLGYVLEALVLRTTLLKLGTVWLGGTFTRGRFRRALELGQSESLPAVIAFGHAAERARASDGVIRRGAGADQRLSWEELFFEVDGGAAPFGRPLSRERAGTLTPALDAVRMGPSASNKQPWRIVRDGDRWHFYLHRTPGYRRRNNLATVADIQRLDMGIAMCHFEAACHQLGIGGGWSFLDPQHPLLDALTTYVATWTDGQR